MYVHIAFWQHCLICQLYEFLWLPDSQFNAISLHLNINKLKPWIKLMSMSLFVVAKFLLHPINSQSFIWLSSLYSLFSSTYHILILSLYWLYMPIYSAITYLWVTPSTNQWWTNPCYVGPVWHVGLLFLTWTSWLLGKGF